MRRSDSSLPTLALLVICGLLGAVLSGAMPAQEVAAEDAGLSTAETARLTQYLPRTFPKLLRRHRVRVVVLGDSISNYYTPAADCHRREKSWHHVFLQRLADRFFFTGSVRDAFARENTGLGAVATETLESPPSLPPRGEVPPLLARIAGGPEIVLHSFARDGATAVQALQPLTTGAFDYNPDLVLFMFGTNDANSNAPVAAFRQSLEAVVGLCRSHQADLIVVGPPLIFGSPLQLARTRPFARAARQIAGKAGVLFADAGKALGRVAQEAAPDEKTAWQVFLDAVAKSYRHEGKLDALHPNAAGHETIANAVWESLFSGEMEDSFHPTAGLVLADAPSKFPSLLLTLHEPAEPKLAANPQAHGGPAANMPQPPAPDAEAEKFSAPPVSPAAKQHPLTSGHAAVDAADSRPPAAVTGVVLSVLPVDSQWQLVEEPTFAVKEFSGRRTMRLPLGPLAATGSNAYCGESVTVSFVLHDGIFSRLLDVDAGVLPIAMEIPIGRQEGIAGDLSLDCTLVNLEQEPFHGTATVHWLARSYDLEVAVEGKSTKPLRLRVPIPTAGPSPLREPFKVTLKSGERQYLFLRTIEATRNLGLGEKYPLTPGAAGTEKMPPGQFMPTVMVKADAVGLYTSFELPPLPEQRSAALPSATVSLSIDARAPGDRGKPGFVDLLSVDIPWQDGPASVRQPHPAIFGNGYDRELNSAHFRASVATESAGRRLVRIDIPRNYFYLHQWSLVEAGQNTLGFDAVLSLPAFSAEQPEGYFAPENAWELSQSSFPRRDTQRLSVLELRTKPSGAWTVRIF